MGTEVGVKCRKTLGEHNLGRGNRTCPSQLRYSLALCSSRESKVPETPQSHLSHLGQLKKSKGRFGEREKSQQKDSMQPSPSEGLEAKRKEH